MTSQAPSPGALAGRTILVTGGTRGSGLAGAEAWHGLGAEIVLGSRSEDRYAEIAASLGGRRIRPFIADLGDPASLKLAIDSLVQSGIRVTDMVHCAAGGLEPILRPLMRAVAAVGRLAPGPDREQALADYRHELARRVADAESGAWRVNMEGPRQLVSQLIESMPDGARLITYSSIWTATVRTTGCPAFYRAIAESKAAFEEWLDGESPSWPPGRLHPIVVVIPLIGDTAMGRLIDRHLGPLLGEVEQRNWHAIHVSSADVTDAVSRLLLEPLPEASALRRVYLVGPGQLRDSLDPRMAVAAAGIPF